MLQWFKENAVSIKEAEMLNDKVLNGKIVVGEFVKRERPTLLENIYNIIGEIKSGDEAN